PRGGTGEGGAVEPYTVKGSRKWVDIPNDPADISGGYLLEYEIPTRYDTEVSGFVTSNGQCVVVKSPEYASESEVMYIADIVDAATRALYSETGRNAEGKHYGEYFDLESLVNMYILQELGMNHDAAWSSFYLFKSAGSGKLYFSPVWDMDRAFGERGPKYGIGYADTSVWFANIMGCNDIPSILTAAYSHAGFRQAVSERWSELRGAGVLSAGESYLSALKEHLRDSAVMNSVRWDLFDTVDTERVIARWSAYADTCLNFVSGRVAALDKGFGENGAYVYFDKTAAYSYDWGYPVKICEIGDVITVPDVASERIEVEAPEGMAFAGWSEQRDGGGAVYQPGDEYELVRGYTVLYAQWKRTAEVMYGDVDADGSVTAADARLALRKAVKLEELTPAQLVDADVDLDGGVTAADARSILRYSIGLEAVLPVG
ncbi:MAG: CotH kinase family protein, partial [Clostridia bacterium]|nr:CotH kinase family protein [Clostridia bacterium]